MLRLPLGEILSWRWAGVALVAALVATPWLMIAGRKPVANVDITRRPAVAAPQRPAGRVERPRLMDMSAWIPPLSERTRHVLTVSYADEAAAAVDEPALRPVVSADSPELLTPQGEELYPSAGATAALPDEPAEAPEISEPPELTVPSAMPVEQWSEPAIAPPLKLRSETMERIAQQADRHSRHGFELASRNAHFAARTEFVTALRLLAQGLDSETGSVEHSRALGEAMNAMREAEDFVPAGDRLEADLRLADIVAGHTTSSQIDVETDKLTAMLALRRYLTFAQERLVDAAGGEVAASIALQALGKLHVALAENRSVAVVAAEPKAVAFLQAAILVYPNNFMASNDLGVLLARAGHHDDARAVLEHSAIIGRHPAAWHNLARLYRRLNRPDLAQRADWQAAVLRQGRGAPASVPVEWVDATAFAQPSGTGLSSTASSSPEPPRPTQAAATQPSPTPRPSRTSPATRPSVADRFSAPRSASSARGAAPVSSPWAAPARR